MDYEDTSGPEAFRAAVLDGHFDAILLRGGVTPETDRVVEEALRGNSRYRLAAVVPFTLGTGSHNYHIWVRQ
ncbi:hypothetical protein [Streptomyces sp. NPDC059564]|uniref:hypothetical protein n=1 Tax=Streptomyces sp. NPDC059564 TaxID=3346865 RepID=UPI0036B3D528